MIDVRPLREDERGWVRSTIRERWGSEIDEGAVDRARSAKPEIPLVGNDCVEIHNELEYEFRPE